MEKLAKEHKINAVASILIEHIDPGKVGVEHKPVKVQRQNPYKLSDLQRCDGAANTVNRTSKMDVHEYMDKAIRPHAKAERLEAADISNASSRAMVKHVQKVKRLLLHHQHERVDQFQIFAPVEDVVKSGELGSVTLENKMIVDRRESPTSSH